MHKFFVRSFLGLALFSGQIVHATTLTDDAHSVSMDTALTNLKGGWIQVYAMRSSGKTSFGAVGNLEVSNPEDNPLEHIAVGTCAQFTPKVSQPTGALNAGDMIQITDDQGTTLTLKHNSSTSYPGRYALINHTSSTPLPVNTFYNVEFFGDGVIAPQVLKKAIFVPRLFDVSPSLDIPVKIPATMDFVFKWSSLVSDNLWITLPAGESKIACHPKASDGAFAIPAAFLANADKTGRIYFFAENPRVQELGGMDVEFRGSTIITGNYQIN